MGDELFPLPADPAAQVRLAGLPLGQEMTEVHYHAHLDIDVDGRHVLVPANIGITPQRLLSPLHTHADVTSPPGASSGIVHIEATRSATGEEPVFRLGQLFTEWGVRLDRTCLGTFCADATHQLLAFVNGQPTADPAAISFSPHAEIYLWYGSPTGDAPRAPATYDFAGY